MQPAQTIVPLKLDFAAEKGGHGRLDRVETGLLSRTLPIRTKGADRSTQASTRCAPLLKSKSKRLSGIISNLRVF